MLSLRSRIRKVCLAPACLFGLLACLPAPAIDRNRRIDQLYHTSWTLKDGAPSEIFAMAQTVDGYLWLGTTSGLVRFDGLHFTDYEPQPGQALPERNVSALLAMPDGGLWIGFGAGGASLLQRGQVANYNSRNGMPPGSVRAFARDRAGHVWAAALGGLARLEGSQWKVIGADWNFSGGATTVYADREGTLWVGTPDSVFFLLEGSKQFRKAADGLKYVTRFGEASDGTLWMAEMSRSVRPVPFPADNDKTQYPEIRKQSIAMLFDGQGSLWATTIGAGIHRMPYPERSRWTASGKSISQDVFTKKGLSSDYIESIFEDSEGDIWIGTNAGLDRFRQSTVVSVALTAPLTYMSLMAAERGTVWVGHGNSPLWRIEDGRLSADLPHELEPLLTRASNCLYRDPQGSNWLADTRKLVRFTKGRVEQIDYPQGPAATVNDRTGIAIAMTAEAPGRLWASILGNGVFRLDGRRWTNIESLGGPKGVALSAFTDPGGRVWLGYSDKTLVMVDRERIRVLSADNGVKVGRVRCIHGRSLKIWIGGDTGVAMFDGSSFRPLLQSDGNTFQDVFGIVETAHEGLWFSSHNGIVHVPEKEVRLFQKMPERQVSYQVFSLLDGLPLPLQKSSATPSVVESSDGLLWFATTQGVVWVDPKRIAQNAVPPPVSIEAVVANGKRYSPPAALALPAHTTNLDISYAGLSLSIPERVKFRYRLEGSDPGWQDAGSRREAFYTNLGPGSYRFQVMACNADGVWSQASAALSLYIAPAYYQTVWFKTFCVLLAAGLLWPLYLLRLKQVTAHVQARLGERLIERERIARELHDTLLQGFNGLVLRFEAVMKQVPPDGPARKMMESALERADQVLLEGRQRVRDLRSDATSGSELAESLAAYGQELSQDGASAFSLAIMGAPRPLDAIAYDEVYRIGREALANAFQHSHGSKIEVEVTYEPTRLRLRVRDDGCGIDRSVLDSGRPGHWGLSGVRERASQIGARINIWSNKGAGTELELLVPAAVVYRRNSKASRWRFLRRFMPGDGTGHV